VHLYVEPLQRAKAIERLWVLYELATNFDAYGELSLGFSKKGHAELLGIARGLATEFESDARCRDGAGLRAAKARPHCATTSAATHLHPHHLLHHRRRRRRHHCSSLAPSSPPPSHVPYRLVRHALDAYLTPNP